MSDDPEPSFGAAFLMGEDMGFEYCVLPDGSIFKLSCPGDFVLAREIARDEIGDAAEDADGD